jgi:hypothetical protein
VNNSKTNKHAYAGTRTPNYQKENPQDVFLRDYVSFVPRRVLPELPSMHEAMARCQHFEGVVSFVDLAGFTKLTERLALQV